MLIFEITHVRYKHNLIIKDMILAYQEHFNIAKYFKNCFVL